jgi:hypothetical protein
MLVQLHARRQHSGPNRFFRLRCNRASTMSVVTHIRGRRDAPVLEARAHSSIRASLAGVAGFSGVGQADARISWPPS